MIIILTKTKGRCRLSRWRCWAGAGRGRRASQPPRTSQICGRCTECSSWSWELCKIWGRFGGNWRRVGALAWRICADLNFPPCRIILYCQRNSIRFLKIQTSYIAFKTKVLKVVFKPSQSDAVSRQRRKIWQICTDLTSDTHTLHRCHLRSNLFWRGRWARVNCIFGG